MMPFLILLLLTTSAWAQQPAPPDDPMSILQMRFGGAQQFLQACSLENGRMIREIATAQAEIAKLKAEIEAMKKPPEKPNAK